MEDYIAELRDFARNAREMAARYDAKADAIEKEWQELTKLRQSWKEANAKDI